MGCCDKAICQDLWGVGIMENCGFAVVDESSIQKAKKIIACIEYVMNGKLEHKRILEIVGSGLISYEMSKYGNEVITVDVQDKSLKDTIYKYQIQFKDFNFLLASGYKLPFKPNSFDVVICNQVIEHVPKQYQQQLIDNVYSILKSNGIFYIATPNKLWPIEPHTKLLFLSYLPRMIANKYVKLFKKVDEYNVDLLTYNKLNKMLSYSFEEVLDFHFEIIRNHKRFHMDCKIPHTVYKLIALMPIELINKLSNFSPSWINIAIKNNLDIG